MANFTNTTHETIITGTSKADSIVNYGFKVTISTGNGDDTVENIYKSNYGGYDSNGNWIYSAYYVSINTGEGNDSVYNYRGDWCTINTGEGNDLISLSSKSYGNYYGCEENVIIYNSGDGKDKIYGFDYDDTLKISGGSYSTAQSGYNIIVTVDDGQISIIGAAGKMGKIEFTQTTPVETNKWTIDGTIATYGTSNKTLVTVKGVGRAQLE